MPQVSWLDRKGAGHTRSFQDTDKLATFLSGLRAEATIRDSAGNKIGAVKFAPDIFDDSRRKWAWYFDGESL